MRWSWSIPKEAHYKILCSCVGWRETWDCVYKLLPAFILFLPFSTLRRLSRNNLPFPQNFYSSNTYISNSRIFCLVDITCGLIVSNTDETEKEKYEIMGHYLLHQISITHDMTIWWWYYNVPIFLPIQNKISSKMNRFLFLLKSWFCAQRIFHLTIQSCWVANFVDE